MNKLVQKAACIALLAALMGGCSMNDKKDANMKTNETKEAAEKSVKDAKNKTEDSIDNVMNYFKDKGLKYENSKAITDIDFAAYEGRSFDYNGSTGYLYRVKTDDDNMKKVLKEAKDNGKVKVSINNKEQEYGAKVNGDFLFLYDTNADWNDVVTAFPNYTYAGTGTTGTNGTNGVSEPSNPGTTKNANEQNSNVNTPNDAKNGMED